jgi:nicotinamidase-related amidase
MAPSFLLHSKIIPIGIIIKIFFKWHYNNIKYGCKDLLSAFNCLLLWLNGKCMKALLIIDMQNGSFTKETPRHNADNVVHHINQLSGVFRANKDMVIFIQHDGSLNGDFIPGTEEWSLLQDLQQHSSDQYISKTANDCFHKSTLREVLLSKNISELVITGCATDFCVDATIKSAFTKGYTITVINDAHTTADREGIPASKLINHYNWVWNNMLPLAVGSLAIASCAHYLASESK